MKLVEFIHRLERKPDIQTKFIVCEVGGGVLATNLDCTPDQMAQAVTLLGGQPGGKVNQLPADTDREGLLEQLKKDDLRAWLASDKNWNPEVRFIVTGEGGGIIAMEIEGDAMKAAKVLGTLFEGEPAKRVVRPRG